MCREGLMWVIPGSVSGLMEEWAHLVTVSDSSLWNLIPYALIWSVWLSRNEKHFNDKSFKAYEVWDSHILKLFWWIKSVWKECPFDSTQFLTNFSDLRIAKKVSPQRSVAWSPPSPGFLKFNVDGASQGNPGPSGIGGVIRNHNNVILGYFSKNIGHGWHLLLKLKPFFRPYFSASNSC